MKCQFHFDPESKTIKCSGSASDLKKFVDELYAKLEISKDRIYPPQLKSIKMERCSENIIFHRHNKWWYSSGKFPETAENVKSHIQNFDQNNIIVKIQEDEIKLFYKSGGPDLVDPESPNRVKEDFERIINS